MAAKQYTQNPPDHPYYRILTDEKMEMVHEAIVEIFETVGIKVARPHAVEMFASAGCEVNGDVVRVPREVLKRAMDSAPGRFTVYNREGEEALHIGDSAVYTHTGYTPLEIFDVETGERRDYTVEDFALVSRVADALPNVDVVGTPGVVRPTPEDPLEVINHLEVEATLTNTSKPLHLLVATGDILNDCFEMAEAIAVANGAKSLREKPFVIGYANPISPLILNEDTVDKILVTAEWGLPMLCGPLPISGGTAPVTMAGSMAQAMVETLAGLVLSQIKRPGTPYIMTASASPMDMMTGNLAGFSPERDLMVGASIEMGHYYGLPIKGGFMGGGYRGTLDGQSGWSQMLNGLTRMLTGGSAGLCSGPGTSIEAGVMADELVGMLKAMMEGVPVDDETLAVDVIREIGAGGGTYLGHPHTYRHFRERWTSRLEPNQRYEEWVEDGSKTMDDHVKERLREIIATHRPKPIPEQAQRTIDRIIQRARDRASAGAAAAD